MTTATKTRTGTIAGHPITLTTGRRYLASRDMATRGRTEFEVRIADITDGVPAYGEAAREIAGLTYKAANALLAGFNDGPTSFSGRIW